MIGCYDPILSCDWCREWVSPAAVTYLVHRMVETQGEYDQLLDQFTVSSHWWRHGHVTLLLTSDWSRCSCCRW